MTRSRTAKLQKAGGKELPPISLDDIKSVKLRSIGDKRGVKVSIYPGRMKAHWSNAITSQYVVAYINLYVK